MSFQGDVAGIGLGELLQGLARGGRDGVLTLRGGALGATLGLTGGQLYLLPEPDEDPESWRKRCERAWVKDPNHRIDTLRMSEIAFAARLETMFQLLDGEGLHFRFEPGEVPTASAPPDEEAGETPLGRVETGSKLEVKVPIHCHGISVEFLLLEYARLTDECRAHGDANLLPVHYVPRLLVPEVPSPELERFWAECDGMSNVGEITDRLGWPLRQCKATLVDLSVKGYVRFCDARELLALAQNEIAQNYLARGASRLSGWCLASPPGPPTYEDAELLLQEWQRGKLPVVLASMEAPTARTLLRRIDLVGGHASEAVERWKEMRKHHRHDSIAELALVHWRMRSEDDADAPHANDLLRLARSFQDQGWYARAGVILHAASERLPESTSVRLEVGSRLIAVGRVEEGTHWVLEACRTLIEAGFHDKALAPLRSLLAADKNCREARRLLSVARNRSSSGKRARRVSVVSLSTALVVSLAAFVKVRVDQDYDRRMAEVQEVADDPEQALVLLERNFGDDASQRVASLRATFMQRIRAERDALRDEWTAHYVEAQQECTTGDELRGLQLALELPEPPDIPGSEDTWPTLGELLDGLGARLEQTFTQFPPIDPEGSLESEEELRREKRFNSLVEQLRTDVAGRERTFTLEAFLKRIDTLRSRIAERETLRTAARETRQEAELEQQQDKLLHAARLHHETGDLDRAVECYDQLEASDQSGMLRFVLRSEIDRARGEQRVVQQALELAEQGEHARAAELIREQVANPHLYMLPCRVESQPSGARARFGDGGIRVTPFTLEVALEERIEISFEHPGFESDRFVLEGPQDVSVLLSRLPELTWSRGALVEALPIAVEDGYVTADRGGTIALLDASGKQLWERRLGTLGGVARTPVFLPRRQGTLLAVTEDGSVWLVDVDGGLVEGPWNIESPPVAGPLSMPDGVLIAFADERIARWNKKLRPEILRGDDALSAETREALERAADGPPNGETLVLRHSAAVKPVLQPPWSEWTVEVGETHVHVTHPSEPERSFAVKLAAKKNEKKWSFVAWEAPTAVRPGGRLWVSDNAGLRAFDP